MAAWHFYRPAKSLAIFASFSTNVFGPKFDSDVVEMVCAASGIVGAASGNVILDPVVRNYNLARRMRRRTRFSAES